MRHNLLHYVRPSHLPLQTTRSLDVDFFDFEIQPDTMILMCSDGLSNMVTNDEIADLLERPGNLKEKGKALILPVSPPSEPFPGPVNGLS